MQEMLRPCETEDGTKIAELLQAQDDKTRFQDSQAGTKETTMIARMENRMSNE